MNPRDLPLVGPLENAGGHGFFGQYSDLSGKHLLCIGFSEQEVTDYVAEHEPASITLLTNWADHKDAQISKYPLIVGDITKRTQFSDSHFDAVLTLSVLEHLNDLHGAFREMVRLVRPGGEMLHMFGPAWSCAYGHHMYMDADDPNLNFSLWNMPAHMHLLCSPEEIKNYYRDLGYIEGTADWVVRCLYETPIINRRNYDEYARLMANEVFQIDQIELMYNRLPADHLRNLRAAHFGIKDFSTYGGRYRLFVNK